MDKSHFKKYEPIDGKWYITKELGSGSFGTVFEVERRDFTNAKAALKIITIPSSNSELENYRRENFNLDEKSVTSYFYGFVEEFIKEIKVMLPLKGNSNIVSIEDYDVKEHSGEIGWDIFIRMELLTPMSRYYLDHMPEQKDIIKLGTDICKALEICRKYNIIHRDIKPGNIFISDTGEFKLGDFGIARTLEKTSSGLSKKGTYTYMAPEVYRGEPYGSNVDIYSLGLVMYRLANNNMEPFRTDNTFPDMEKAFETRMKGAKIPAPANADEKLAQIILKACSFDPRDRYESPDQMRKDLESIVIPEKSSRIINSNTNTATFIPPNDAFAGGIKNPTGSDGKTKIIAGGNKPLNNNSERTVGMFDNGPIADVKTPSRLQNTAGANGSGPKIPASKPAVDPVKGNPYGFYPTPNARPASRIITRETPVRNTADVRFEPGIPRTAEHEKTGEEKKSKKKLRTILLAVIAAVIVIIITFCITAMLIIKNKYEAAMDEFNNGNYEAAVALFKKLPSDYKDVRDMINESIYQRANEYLESEKYSSAESLFNSISDYRDSEEMVKECNYRLAYSTMLDKGDYSKAKEMFQELSSYMDSEEMVLECDYLMAKSLMDSGDYEEAKNLFRELSSYKNSKDMIKECDYKTAVDYKNKSDYVEAMKTFNDLGDYKNSETQFNSCESELISLNRENNYFAGESDMIGEWSDDSGNFVSYTNSEDGGVHSSYNLGNTSGEFFKISYGIHYHGNDSVGWKKQWIFQRVNYKTVLVYDYIDGEAYKLSLK